MNTHKPNYGQSVKVRLLNLAKQENIRYQQLVTRYFQERLLFRLSLSEYRSHFVLQEAIRATFENRDTHYSENHILFSDKFAHAPELNQRWNAFLKKIKYEPTVPFAEVMNRITQWLKPYWESLKD